MTESLPTADRVQSVLDAPKALVKQMSWSEQHGNRNPPRFEYRSAVNLDTGLVMEGVGVISQWKQSPIPGIEPAYQFGLFVEVKHRIYAVDIRPAVPHQNKKGIGHGLPYYRQRLPGSHEHIWTGQYGYAEPLDLDANMEGHWNYFCERANIVSGHEFYSPEFDMLSGQGRLL